MFPNRLMVLAAILFLGGSGCVHLGHCKVSKGPKTLFAWSLLHEEKEDDCKEEENSANDAKSKDKENQDNNSNDKGDSGKKGDSEEEKDQEQTKKEPQTSEDEGNQNGNGEEEEEEPIQTDRPDFTEASSTVGRGRIQLEAGYTFFHDREFGERLTAHSYPEMLWRIGLFADWFELRIGQNFASERIAPADGPVERNSGAEDLYLGVKLALTEQKQFLPEMALVLQATIPTGAREFNARQVLPGANLLYGWDITDWLSCAGSTQINRALGEFVPLFDVPVIPLGDEVAKHYYMELAQSFTIGYTLTDKLGAFTEWFAFFPTSSLDQDTLPEYYFNGGFTYRFTPNIQGDIRAGLGLNEHADDFFAGIGFATRH